MFIIYIYIYIYTYNLLADDACGGPPWHLGESVCAAASLAFLRPGSARCAATQLIGGSLFFVLSFRVVCCPRLPHVLPSWYFMSLAEGTSTALTQAARLSCGAAAVMKGLIPWGGWTYRGRAAFFGRQELLCLDSGGPAARARPPFLLHSGDSRM